jgi:hypothetical protein
MSSMTAWVKQRRRRSAGALPRKRACVVYGLLLRRGCNVQIDNSIPAG